MMAVMVTMMPVVMPTTTTNGASNHKAPTAATTVVVPVVTVVAVVMGRVAYCKAHQQGHAEHQRKQPPGIRKIHTYDHYFVCVFLDLIA